MTKRAAAVMSTDMSCTSPDKELRITQHYNKNEHRGMNPFVGADSRSVLQEPHGLIRNRKFVNAFTTVYR
jgi:hypothetical protein